MPDQSVRTPEEQVERAGPAAAATPSGGGVRAWLTGVPARFSLFVFVATLVTSLGVGLVSVVSMDGFLRARIDRKFPAMLTATSQKLESWYKQRELEMRVFSRSAILRGNTRILDRGIGGQAEERTRAEVAQYLDDVLRAFPQYAAAFVLDARGRAVASAGQGHMLSPSQRAAMQQRARDVRPDATSIYALGPDAQIASARIGGDSPDTTTGSIHALLRRDALEAQLASDDLGTTGSIFVIDRLGRVVIGHPRGGFANDVLATLDSGGVGEYAKENDERMVGSARAFGRFGWTVVVEETYDEAFAPTAAALQRVIGLDLLIALVLCPAAFLVALGIARPIHALADAAAAIERGESDISIPAMNNRDEVGLLARTLSSMISRLAANRQEIERSHQEVEASNRELELEKRELQRANEVLEQLSITDGLTKLHNHRFFQDQLVREARRADRTGDPLSLVLIDIDEFKGWNDRLGHATGDEILRKLASTLNDTVRETDLLARYGGEEFAILLSKTTLEGAVALAEKARERVAEAEFGFAGPQESARVTISAGVSHYRGDRIRFFAEADEALYRAKDAGRDCVVAAPPSDEAQEEA